MRAFIVPQFGATGAIGERAKPEPGEGQLLVRVRAAGVNAMDPIIRAGFAKDFMEHRLPLTLGLDYAGTVEAVGRGVEGFAPGDEVFGAVGKPFFGEGTFAEYVTATAALAARRPTNLPAERAAALPTAGGTALAAVDALAAQPGDTAAVIDAVHDAQGLLALVPAVRPGGRIASPSAQGAEQAFAGQPATFHAVRAALDRVAELGELAAAGKLTVDVEVLPLEQAAEAVHRQSTRGNRGKLVLAIG